MSNMTDDIWNVNGFLDVNKQKITEFSFLSLAVDELNIPVDVIKVIISLCAPEFTIIDNHIFIKSQFNRKKYEELTVSCSDLKEVQYWMNIICISNISDRLLEVDTKQISEKIVNLWNLKIDSIGSNYKGRAHVIKDEDDGYFITIN